ncbi:hypothetical protein LSH36_188g09049 [Paralvinella palmiformis]|uniref:Uncharacterized protein n=1 Tax=Paralvinella palmiformis TaxID=53620 RepID=A0AAD9JQQ2_9ANNE|nr:hypothetical protein LSH36_188g09049 [Paralvinella palmiformis]
MFTVRSSLHWRLSSGSSRPRFSCGHFVSPSRTVFRIVHHVFVMPFAGCERVAALLNVVQFTMPRPCGKLIILTAALRFSVVDYFGQVVADVVHGDACHQPAIYVTSRQQHVLVEHVLHRDALLHGPRHGLVVHVLHGDALLHRPRHVLVEHVLHGDALLHRPRHGYHLVKLVRRLFDDRVRDGYVVARRVNNMRRSRYIFGFGAGNAGESSRDFFGCFRHESRRTQRPRHSGAVHAHLSVVKGVLLVRSSGVQPSNDPIRQ